MTAPATICRSQTEICQTSCEARFTSNWMPACFALQVQRQNAEFYMPIEDTSIEWDESVSPFETVGDIRPPPQDFDSPGKNVECDYLAFNPWHTLPDHCLIGGINRLLKAVYEAVSAYRLEPNMQY